MSVLIFLILGNCSFVYASEFGGFDVSTGTGEYEGDWSDWDDEPTYNAPEQDNGDSYTNEVRNDGQEIAQNNTDSSFYTDDYAYDSEQNWNEQGNSTTSGSDASSTSGYSDDYAGQSRNESGDMNNNGSSASAVTGSSTDGRITSSVVTEITPTVLPTDTPTPVPTPTLAPTFTPTPVFTEIPKEKVNTVTEYREEYRLPPAECLQKMKLFYWREALLKGEYVEILLNGRIVQQVVSIRINGQEKSWKQNGDTLQVKELSDDRNILEIAVMIPKDLTWTGDKKNVILTYNVF